MILDLQKVKNYGLKPDFYCVVVTPFLAFPYG